MAAFEMRVSQLRGGDTLRFGSVAPPAGDHGPLLPFDTRLLVAYGTGTRGLTARPRTTRLI